MTCYHFYIWKKVFSSCDCKIKWCLSKKTWSKCQMWSHIWLCDIWYHTDVSSWQWHEQQNAPSRNKPIVIRLFLLYAIREAVVFIATMRDYSYLVNGCDHCSDTVFTTLSHHSFTFPSNINFAWFPDCNNPPELITSPTQTHISLCNEYFVHLPLKMSVYCKGPRTKLTNTHTASLALHRTFTTKQYFPKTFVVV